ncbi:MAG: CRTAC1 family protein, partial [Acidobacteriota bacterium]
PNGDGWPDLVKTNFESEVNNLYLNSPSGLFSDRAYRAGLGVSMPPMGWGAVFLDVDRDGRLDLFFANGHVYPQVESGELQYPYGQVNMLLLGGFAAGHPTFADVSGRAGPGLQVRRVSRGVAVGDYDGDGDLDLAVNNLDGAPELLRNDTVPSGAWLKVRTLGTRSNRDGLGARVDLLAGGRHRVREVRTSRGFLSSSDRTLLFGLGQLTQVEGLTVSWPSGLTERFKVEGLNRLLLVQEGQGEPAQRWPRPLP